MFDPKVKIRKALYDKVKEAAEAVGCASVEEFIERALEAEADRVLVALGGKDKASAADVEEIAAKLKGLGYLD